MKASNDLGLDVKPMLKFIDFQRCRSCGGCAQGCIYGAKWTAQKSIGDALRAGAKLLTDTSVDLVLHSGGEVKGVRARGPSCVMEIDAENVVVAAGGIDTPVILQRSGLSNAGGNFFADPYVNTVGIVGEDCMGDEVSMATVIDGFHEGNGFIVSPAFDKPWTTFLHFPSLRKRYALRMCRILKLMTKITDDDAGRVNVDGTINKPLTDNDRKKLGKGEELSKSILLQAGADPRSLCTEGVRAGHPGGTAGIGRVVNSGQETEISRLFVSDASVLPEAPGLPPVLTIVALSKRLSKILSSQYM
jgi:choline dehydrogenase-like flavoprotein